MTDRHGGKFEGVERERHKQTDANKHEEHVLCVMTAQATPANKDLFVLRMRNMNWLPAPADRSVRVPASVGHTS